MSSKTQHEMENNYKHSELFEIAECPYCWSLIRWEMRFDHVAMCHPTIPLSEKELVINSTMNFSRHYLREEY